MDINKILTKHLRSLNLHVASERKNLAQLLLEDKPRVKLLDGSFHYFKKVELKKIAEILPQEMQNRLRLPVYIELSSEKYGKGTARIVGKAEVFLISKIIGREVKGEELFVYKPELRIIRKELPTTTQYIFTLGL